MDERLLEYYNDELTYLRETGQKFAEQYPKVANRLGANGVEISDPYVERLLEGFGFLTARIQIKMDTQFPRFSQRILEAVYPNYLAPTPSMGIVQLRPTMAAEAIGSGFTVPRHSAMVSGIIKGEATACEFRTAHDVTLWPLEIVEVDCNTSAAHSLPLASLKLPRMVKGAVRIRLKTTNGMQLNQLNLDQLTFYLSGANNVSSHLYEYLFGHALGMVGCAPQRPATWMEFVSAEHIKAEGFDSKQAMLPYHDRSFEGYRLLHEYFAFSDRYHFFTLGQLKKIVSKASGDTVDLIILLDCPVGDLENLVDKKQLALFCTPIINLFPKRSDRLAIDQRHHEYHVVPDKTRPLDFEIYAINGATGHEKSLGKEQEFRPFYSSQGQDHGTFGAYYSTRREPRVISDTGKRKGTRTNYVGSEVFISLIDQHQPPFNEALTGLSIDMLCTNRDLPLLIPTGRLTDFDMSLVVPLDSIKLLRGPSEPGKALPDKAMTWRLISHLNLNYLTLSDISPTEAAQALRELLSLYSLLSDGLLEKQINAIQQASFKPITRRLPRKGPIAFGRGIAIDVTIDEALFAGTSPFLFGRILEQYFSRHVGMNVATETTLHSLQRGKIGHWVTEMGARRF